MQKPEPDPNIRCMNPHALLHAMPARVSNLNWPHLLLLATLPLAAWASRDWSADLALAVTTLGALAWLLLAERLWPLRRDWQPSRPELMRDAAFLGLNAVVDMFTKLLLMALLLRLGYLGPGWVGGLHAGLALPLAIALGELGPFLLHRLAHRHEAWWRWHALHHQPKRLNSANSVLAHPLNAAWNQGTRLLPWLVLGFDTQVVLWAAMFVQAQGLAVHANLRGTLGPLNRCLGSAELHRWHHSVRSDEAYNYGTAIPLWDQIFGSYVYRPGQTPQELGPFETDLLHQGLSHKRP